MKKMLLLIIILFLVSCYDKFTVDVETNSIGEETYDKQSMIYEDHEGNIYETIEIGHVL